jgi:hypothetical protein
MAECEFHTQKEAACQFHDIKMSMERKAGFTCL